MQSARVERAYVDGHDAVRGQRPSKLRQQDALDSRTAREEHADALGPQPPSRVGEASGRGRVEPLDVVDRNDDRELVGEGTQRVQERETYRVRVRRRAFVVAEDERARQRSVLRGREGSERLLKHGIQEVADAGERKRYLAFGRPGREDAESTIGRFLEARCPEG